MNGISRLAALAASTWALFACGADGAAGDTTPSEPAAAGGMPWIPPAAGGTNPGSGGSPEVGSGGSPGVPNGTGGVAPPPPPPGGRPYDPDQKVNFEFPEDVTSASTCRAGRYVGTFQCEYAGPGPDGGAPTGFIITGPVEFSLNQSRNGEFLEVNGGTLAGAVPFIFFTASLSGELDCQTGLFDGDVTDGTYGLPPPPPPPPLVPGPPLGYFEGPTSATYSPAGPALTNGQWSFAVRDAQGTAQGSCTGTWSATLTP